MSEGKLRANGTDHQMYTADRAFPASGKWYWEVNNLTSDGSNYYAQYMGVLSSDIFHAEQDVSTYDGGNYVGTYIRALAGVSWIAGNDNYYSNFTATSTSNGANHGGWGNEANSTGILSLALDVDAGTLKYYWNNSLVRTDSTLTANIEYFAHANLTASGGNFWNYAYWNFGQDSSFAGTKTAQGNTDANGNGDFYYSVPSGHLALCSANLPEPTIGSNSDTIATDHFETILYSASSGSAGAGSSTAQDIGGLDFKPDWVWIKGRSYADHHALFDSSRGVGKYLLSSATNAEATQADTLDEFRSDGFGLGADSTALVNYQNNTYVSWNWKANGGTTTTNDASSTSVGTVDSVFQANTTAGFSIITYTGTNANMSIAHGLGKVPKWILFKKRNAAQHWVSYHASVGNDREMNLSTTDAQTNTNSVYFNNTSPSTSVITIGTDVYKNANGDTYVAYAFAEVEGFSKFGSYIGNGNADGTFVYTGFRPAFILTKLSTHVSSWSIVDTTRDPFNIVNQYLLAESTGAEGDFDTLDILSNGFKARTTNAERNGVGRTVIYMAFAEAPFKYANAR